MAKSKTINVKGALITIFTKIKLVNLYHTIMLKAKDGDFFWLETKTIELFRNLGKCL
jgi:hypothetical protein